MALSDRNEIWLSSSPHYKKPVTTQKIMLSVILALLPCCAAGVVFFGADAALTILVSVACCVVFEAAFRKAAGLPSRLRDLSAVVTGILLALTLPPSIEVWKIALGAAFSIIVAKEFFGGLGANVFNPALAGRAFLFVSFPASMGKWKLAIDGISASTPLAGTRYDTLDMLLGRMPGCIGETCSAWILAAFVILAATKVIDWRAPVAMVAAAVALGAAFGTSPVDTLLTGGLLFGAVFMATDYTTAPITEKGRLVFGLGCGLITALIRKFSGYPEGVMFSILIMNAFTGFLNRLVPKKYGFVPKGAKK